VDPSGHWFAPENTQSSTEVAGRAPQDTGGPDDFGYTWDDSVALNWVDASGGVDTGIDSEIDHVGPIDIGFPFEYYENTYAQLYISLFGFVAFDADGINTDQSWIPSSSKPNDVIAPHWVPVDGVNGYVRYLRGGTAPNRWLVVEWNQIRSGDDVYTFELILHENGDIDFQYGTMLVQGGWMCASSGIEDSWGWDGLSITELCRVVSSDNAVHIYRPDPSARVSVPFADQGNFVLAGEVNTLQIPVRNTGELGSDTYDVTISTTWPISLYTADGITPLTDTDGDGVFDTGSVSEGMAITVTARITTPALVNVGDANTMIVTACSSIDSSESKSVILQSSIAAPFAQVFRDNVDGAMRIYLAQPNNHPVDKTTGYYHGGNMAVAEMNDGFVYAWNRYRWTNGVAIEEIEYALLDHNGNIRRTISKLTDHSEATVYTHDFPVVAVAPNGHIGVLWYRYLYDTNNSTFNYNIHFAILDGSGDLTYGPVNVTNNSVWGGQDEYGVPRLSEARLTATEDNHFLLAWQHSSEEAEGTLSDIYYTIRDTDGGIVKGITKLTNSTPSSVYSTPAVTFLDGNRALVAYDGPGGISYSVLDSAGNTVREEATTGGYGLRPDVVQLSNSAVLLAWTSYTTDNIHFVMLDSTAYDVIAGPTELSNPVASSGNNYVSVTTDAGGHGILTWTDNLNFPHKLYYALVDENGIVLTDPMVFYTSEAVPPSLDSSHIGYGNTSYSLAQPTAGDVDLWVEAPTFAPIAPDGTVSIATRAGNQGLDQATSVVLTATLDSALSYLDASPAPSSASGEALIWDLPNMDFQGYGQISLQTSVSTTAIGSHSSVTWTVGSAGYETDPSDNSIVTKVTIIRKVYLPLVIRGD
jgi:hypothetical protein